MKEEVLIANKIIECFKTGNKCLVFGNGGSLADAAHFAAEFHCIGPVIALNDPVKITSIANDYGFDFIFSRQILDLGKENDFIIGISSSGMSHNVTVGLAAAGENKMYYLDLPREGKTTQEVQEYQYHLLHNIYLEVKKQLKHDN